MREQSTSGSSCTAENSDLKIENQSSSNSKVKVEEAPDFMSWSEVHSSKLEELMAKFDENIDMAAKKFNSFLNRNVKINLQRNFLYNIDKLTLHIIWRDIQLRNELLSETQKEEHKKQIDSWIHEEKQRILAEKEREK